MTGSPFFVSSIPQNGILIKLTDKTVDKFLVISFAAMEDSKSKSVQIAEHQRDMVLKDISRLLDGYVNSVMLGTSIRNITYSVEVENLGSITNANVKFTPLSMSS